ncbi:unnamed protein product [Durusdinium trenchii]|uniref:Protein-serine/threonine kinase n=1 Tax=Durusdinium trenchii TaxID=1381693 RepID=A0ABP0LJU3_9DINO
MMQKHSKTKPDSLSISIYHCLSSCTTACDMLSMAASQETTRAIRQEGSSTVGLVALGIFKLQRANSQCADDEAYTDDFLDHFLDGFLLSRIGSNMLLDQYFARAPKEAGGLARKTGIISPRCDAVALCKQAADYASRICQMHTGQLPVVLYDNYEAGKGACQADSPCYFSYIPGYLRYIMVELLKNSFKATLMGATAAEIAERPIHILICRDECHVAIRVSDRAGGIPSHVGERIWSYLYGAAARGSDDCSATPLVGLRRRLLDSKQVTSAVVRPTPGKSRQTLFHMVCGCWRWVEPAWGHLRIGFTSADVE